MRNQKNLLGHLVVMSFLMTLVGGNALSSSLQKQVNLSQSEARSTISVQDYELFARAEVGGAGGIYEFVNNTTKQADGICNFSEGRLPLNQAFIFNEVTVGFAKDIVGIPGGVVYNDLAPASLQNSEFVIEQDGRIVLTLPTSSVLNAKSAGNSNNQQWRHLGSLAYLADEGQIVYSFRFASGQTISVGTPSGSDYSYIEVKLSGQRTIKKV